MIFWQLLFIHWTLAGLILIGGITMIHLAALDRPERFCSDLPWPNPRLLVANEVGATLQMLAHATGDAYVAANRQTLLFEKLK